MTNIQTHFNRRSFIKVSAAAGGGVVFGFSLFVSCKKKEELAIIPELEAPDTWFDITAFIKIGDNGVVTIISPNPEVGQNVKTSMPMIVAEELDVDWSRVIVEQAPLDTDKYTRQVAGGSQSIRLGWDGLRMAGATAKTMLVTAAAKQWNTTPEQCTVRNGIIYGPDGQEGHYGLFAAAAANVEIPETINLKEPKDYKIIGQEKRNVDINKIIKGESAYGIDTNRDNMVYAMMTRPPAFGQKLISYDDTDTKNVNGVIDVVRIGDKIAIIAKNTWAAMKGQKMLSAQWSDTQGLHSTDQIDQQLRNLLVKKDAKPPRNDGDVDKAFAVADNIVERVYEAPFLPHNCLEPMNFFADVRADKIELYGPIQTPERTRKRVASALGREEKEIEMGLSRMGGGFGRRLYGDFVEEAALISQEIKKPVQLIFSREDDMTAGVYRPAVKYKIKAAIKNGEISAYELSEACVNGNMYGLIPNFFPAWAIDNYRVNNHQLKSDITIGAWRAPYTNFLAYAEQAFMDELAATMGVDAVKLRLDLLEKAKKHTSDERMQWSPQRFQETIKLAAEKGGWYVEEEGVYKGFSAYYCHNSHVAQVAHVKIKGGEPVVDKVICAVDCGIVINPIAGRNQIEGGIIDGIGHAMYGELNFVDGKPQSQNFNQFRLIRHSEAPRVEVHYIKNELSPTGLGEPSLPPAGGAVANALYKATGQRLYKQPFVKEIKLIG